MEIILASTNAGKVAEIRKMLEPYGCEVKSLKDIDCDVDVEETGTTFAENAKIKASTIHELTGKAVIADDSGICVDYLDGAPGLYSHRWAGEDATVDDRRAKMLRELDGVPTEKRTAHFACAMCFIGEDGKEISVLGKVEGIIATEVRGEEGFEYDPLFIFDGEHTFGEIPSEEKNKISHRAVATQMLIDKLTSEGIL